MLVYVYEYAAAGVSVWLEDGRGDQYHATLPCRRDRRARAPQAARAPRATPTA